jgi:phytoene synthase
MTGLGWLRQGARETGRESSGAADARYCAALARRHARTFTLASWLLPPEKRRASYAVYAFCRVADDIVDAGAPPRAAGRQLAEYARGLDAALAGRPAGPVFRELAAAVARYGIPERVLRDLLDGVARDLAWAPYPTWDALARYCEGVASTVGEMCMHVFGLAAPDGAARDRALGHARTLGVAMQLTNILRDVGEDARRGRCYLPEEDLAAFGLTTADVLGDPAIGGDPRWRPLMAFEVARARALYAAAAPGIALLAPDARRCAAACARGYAAFLDAIAAIGYDSMSTRARIGTTTRLAILWSCRRADAGEYHADDGVGAAERPIPDLVPLG